MSMARITGVLSIALVVVILVFVSSCLAADASKALNIAPNPGAEKAVAGKLPEGWGRYHNTPADMGATDKVFHSGKNSVFLKVTGFGKDGLAVTGLAAGQTDGYNGPAAIPVKPYTKYNFSFYIKGKGFTRKIGVKPWGFKADGSGRDRSIPGVSVLPTDKWTRYAGSFTTKGQTERVVLMFFVYSKKDRDITEGATFYVDDVNLSVAGPIGAAPRDIVLPDKLTIATMMAPNGKLYTWADIEKKFKAGDPYVRGWVSRAMVKARKYADKPDSYYLGLFRPESPFGVSTITCPFHPEMFGWMPFKWSPDNPWRLICPHCEKEGRKPTYYPNEMYPDDGKGCSPTDDVWRKTHTPEWSAKYSIPWKKWDGHTHGHIDGFKFFFLGYAQYRIFFELNWRHNILGNLCNGYVFGSRLYPAGSDEAKLAGVCAGKAKIIMVTMTRAIMGDPYLRDVLGMSEQDYRNAVQSLAKGPDGKPLPYMFYKEYKEYPGYEKRDVISDHSDSDPEHPISTVRGHWRRQTTRFPSRSHSDYAGVWLPSYAMIQSSFTSAERKANLTELIERVLVSEVGDAQHLAKSGQKVKKGVCELGMNPHKLTLRGNLAGGPAWSTLNLGLMLNDKKIIRNVAAASYRYFQPGVGYFTADGLGYETSPHYTHVGLGGIAPVLAALNGMTEGFGP
ncbi:MAG: carbohydrate binding domain-containing protein, partial [Phycisphaerae bacterium]|nr:carbohydrate binding domain-containing protein [Phycisphaerae bacterium]